MKNKKALICSGAIFIVGIAVAGVILIGGNKVDKTSTQPTEVTETVQPVETQPVEEVKETEVVETVEPTTEPVVEETKPVGETVEETPVAVTLPVIEETPVAETKPVVKEEPKKETPAPKKETPVVKEEAPKQEAPQAQGDTTVGQSGGFLELGDNITPGNYEGSVIDPSVDL